MKLTAFLLLAAVIQVSAKGTAQTVTYTAEAEPLTKIFSVIEKQTGFAFIYQDEDVETVKRISVKLRNAEIQTALKLVLRDLPLEYIIEGKTIFIRSKVLTKDLTARLELTAPPVTGIIRGPDGQPLAGANIVVKGTKRGTTSAADGSFSIEADNDDVLVVSSIGYIARQINISENTTGVITLALSDSKLDEVQIIAYGQTSQRLNTGNVSTIKATDIQKQPVNNPLLALSGKVPGVFVEQNSGLPGTSIKVRIQGQNSISRGSDPFYVIDGVPFAAQLLTSVGVSINGPGGNGNPFSFINPSDILSIDVLKDADATSIYGSRAANGAILITTKKGKAGKTKVDIGFRNGWGKVPKKIDLMNTQEYLAMRQKAFANDEIDLNAPPFNSTFYKIFLYPDLAFWNQNAYTDWQEVLLGGTSGYRDANISVSGGNANTTFLVGANYHKETTVFPSDFSDSKGSVHFSLNNTSDNRRFKTSFSGSYLFDDNRLPGVPDLTYTAITLAPNSPALRKPDGSLNWEPIEVDGTFSSSFNNPIALMNQRLNIKTTNLIANAVVEYEVIKNLNVKSSFGYTAINADEIQVTPATVLKPEDIPFYNRTSYFGDNSISSWIIEPQLSYKISSKIGAFDLLLGSTFQNNYANGLRLEAKGFNSDLVMEDIRSATSVTPFQDLGTTIFKYRYNALFGRLNYNIGDKYILNLSARRDGSSRFGGNNRFHDFASIAGAWLFTNEKVFKSHLSFISFGKIKASYGTTGNDQIGNYQYLSLYVPTTAELAYQNANGLQINNLPNPYLQWEETRKLSVGLDLGFLDDRILVNINYSRNRSSNQLVSLPLATTTGFTDISANLPATVQNTGWELSFNSINIKSGDFSWSSGFNITIPRNKLIAFPDLANSGYADMLIIGQPLNVQRLYELAGVNKTTGLYEYLTKESGNVSTPDFSRDRNYIITTDPKFYGGFQSTFRYKQFELDLLFSFVKQIGYDYYYGTTINGTKQNQPKTVLNAWQKPGDEAPVQRYVTGMNFNNFLPAAYLGMSNAAYDDASYVRLKNVSLSWQIPARLLSKLHIDNAKIFFNGQNVATFTSYNGLDPETRSTNALPLLRMLTIGAQVGL